MTPPAFRIRPYLEADEAAVVALWREVFPGDYSPDVPRVEIRRKLAVQRDLFLVGELRGRVVATVLAGFDGHRGWLHLVAVAPDCRRNGFGRAILAEAEARLRAAGCGKINLHVRSENPAAIAFYESLGFAVEPDICMGKVVD